MTRHLTNVCQVRIITWKETEAVHSGSQKLALKSGFWGKLNAFQDYSCATVSRLSADSSRSEASVGKLSQTIIPCDWQGLLHNPIQWDET